VALGGILPGCALAALTRAAKGGLVTPILTLSTHASFKRDGSRLIVAAHLRRSMPKFEVEGWRSSSAVRTQPRRSSANHMAVQPISVLMPWQADSLKKLLRFEMK
jgi:hypothetical protein